MDDDNCGLSAGTASEVYLLLVLSVEDLKAIYIKSLNANIRPYRSTKDWITVIYLEPKWVLISTLSQPNKVSRIPI